MGTSLKRKGRPDKGAKPSKPRPDFPLTANSNGQWSKKICGKVYYFGVWSDPEAALSRYLKVAEYRHAGREPPTAEDGMSVCDVCNQFLTTKQNRVKSGELTQRTFDDYYGSCERLIHVFGKSRLVNDLTPRDFETLRASITKSRGHVATSNEISQMRSTEFGLSSILQSNRG